MIAHLYLIGEPDSPYAHWLTDWDAPLLYSLYGRFYPSSITRGKVTSEFGLKVQTMDITWSPPPGNFNSVLSTTSPYQKVRLGWYDGWPIRVWKCYMPTKGDANTLGAAEWFGGRVGQATLSRGKITFTINSFLDALNAPVPGAIIESQNPVAANRGATPPPGLTVVPQFSVYTNGNSNRVIVGDATSPTPGQIFAAGIFKYGFLVFNDTTGAGGALSRAWSVVLDNQSVAVGVGTHNQFTLYNPMPWVPVPGVDTFYVSAAYPINKADGSYYGFPFVPAPENAF
jgi:hypothetical protein